MIEYNNPIPLYKQMSKLIKNKIDKKELKPGDRIESENDLSIRYGISRITVRYAIKELVEEGILNKIQGKGTYVSVNKEKYYANDYIGFTRSCILSGKKATTKLISSGFTLPNRIQADFFNIGENDKIVYTKRLRLVDNYPTVIETNYYNTYLSFLLEENLERSLFELLKNKYNIIIKNIERTLETYFPNKEEIELLNIKKGTPLLLFMDEQLDQYDNPLFLSRQVYCTEKIKFYF